MLVKDLPSADILRQLLRYDDGQLYWLERGPEWFTDAPRRSALNQSANWNVRYAGKPAFRQIHGGRYLGGKLLGGTYLAHRVIWKLINGEDPEFIDHISGDKTDNRIENLRDVTWGENTKNRPAPRNNTSGCAGVWWFERANRWRAQISTTESPCQYLGQLKTYEEAVAARKEAEVTHGYHENHGR